MKFKHLAIVLLSGSLFFTSCNNDDDSTPDVPQGAYDNGILILSEGNFGASNSGITFSSKDFQTQEANIFSVVNGENMGDTGQDIGFHEDLAYIVMHGSHEIHVVNRYNFELVTTISSGLLNPRYIAFANNKAYVTNWGNGSVTTDDYVAVIDLATNQIIKNIPVIEGPERIVEDDNKLYVAHKGGYGNGNSISVISAANDSFLSNMVVGDVPNSLEIENGILYVLCGGIQAWSPGAVSTIGSLHQINLSNNTRVNHNFGPGQHPSNLEIEDNKIYYTVNEKIYVKNLSDALPTQELFSTTSQGVYGVYSFEVEDGKIYVGDAKDYNSNGSVYVYSTSGTYIDEIVTGVTPTGIYFND